MFVYVLVMYILVTRRFTPVSPVGYDIHYLILQQICPLAFISASPFHEVYVKSNRVFVYLVSYIGSRIARSKTKSRGKTIKCSEDKTLPCGTDSWLDRGG